MPANVKFRGVVQRFGRTEVLRGVDLEIGAGVFALLGPNGAGKTTFLRTLATIIKPSEGELEILGHDISNSKSRRSIRRRLGYLPQSFAYYPNFTVTEFVEYFALLKEVPTADLEESVTDAIKYVGLEDQSGKKLRKLSGGMLRRVSIAQAIVNRPDLLLLDEPTAGLDPEQRVTFRALVREIGERSTVIISTHLVEDVAAACSRVAVMKDGRLRFHGLPEELVRIGERESGVGDTPLERGYTSVLAEATS